jgi:flagellar hook-length control protein FliK
MQDLMIQAQFLEARPAETRTQQQKSTSSESSFDDALAARLDDRERKKTQTKDSVDPNQMAGAQAQQTSVVEQNRRRRESEAESSDAVDSSAGASTAASSQAGVQEDAPSQVTPLMVDGEFAEMVVQAAESELNVPSGDVETEGQKNTLVSMPAIPAAESERSSDKSMMIENMETADSRQTPKGEMKTGNINVNQNRTHNEEENTASGDSLNEFQVKAQPAQETPINEPSGENSKANQSGQEFNASSTAGKTEHTRIDGQVEASPPEATFAVQDGPGAINALASEPARSAEAQPTFLPQIEDSITQMLKSKQTSLRIQLHPEDLGRIQLRLIQDENGLRVTMHADHSETGQLLERHLHSLQKSLNDAGIQLTGFDINSGNQNHQQQTPAAWRKFRTSAAGTAATDSVTELNRPAHQHSIDAAVDYRI